MELHVPGVISAQQRINGFVKIKLFKVKFHTHVWGQGWLRKILARKDKES